LTRPTAFLFALFTLDEKKLNVRAMAILGNADVASGALTSVAASAIRYTTHYSTNWKARFAMSSVDLSPSISRFRNLYSASVFASAPRPAGRFLLAAV
jgi:hypothetical protein